LVEEDAPAAKQKYTVKVEQKFEGFIDIEAESEQEAVKIAEQRYSVDGKELPNMDDCCCLHFSISEGDDDEE
jgi:hypothetical protein